MRLTAALGLLCLITACVKREGPPPIAGPGSELPGANGLDFSLKHYPDHADYKLSSLRGKVVLLDVWATWCDPCRDAMPLYTDLQKQYGARGFQVVTLNVDADESQIPQFLTEAKLELPIVLDPNAAYAENTLKVKVMPTAFFLDRSGRVREMHEGFSAEFLEKYIAEIELLLKEPAPEKK